MGIGIGPTGHEPQDKVARLSHESKPVRERRQCDMRRVTAKIAGLQGKGKTAPSRFCHLQGNLL